MKVALFAVELDAAGLSWRVQLNGLPLGEAGDGAALRTSLKANAFVIEGDNVLEVALGPTASRATARFLLQFRRADPGTPIGEEPRLAHFVWNRREAPLPTEGRRVVWSATVPVASAFGRWAWQSSPEGPLKDDGRHRVLEVVRALRAALEARDIEGVLRLQERRDAELSRALGSATRVRVDGLRMWLQDLSSASDWRIDAAPEASLRLEELAGGRLVRVTTVDGRPPISVHGAGETAEFPLLLCQFEGRWQIIR